MDIIAQLLEVPACLIMKRAPPTHDVFVFSDGEDNPYGTESKFKLNSGLYCDAVMKGQSGLTVLDATSDPSWHNNPDLDYGMSFYIGFPLLWPDDTVFGTICVLDKTENNKATSFINLLEEFKFVIENELNLLIEINVREKSEQELCRVRDELEVRVVNRTNKLAKANQDLLETNTALKVLIQNFEESKSEFESQIISNVRKTILPYIDKMKSRMTDERGDAYLSILETNLAELTNTVSNKLTDKMVLLTPKETEIVKLIQQGKTTKEIARILTTATSTVDFHRNNIRKKLGIKKGGVNLGTYLWSMN